MLMSLQNYMTVKLLPPQILRSQWERYGSIVVRQIRGSMMSGVSPRAMSAIFESTTRKTDSVDVIAVASATAAWYVNRRAYRRKREAF